MERIPKEKPACRTATDGKRAKSLRSSAMWMQIQFVPFAYATKKCCLEERSSGEYEGQSLSYQINQGAKSGGSDNGFLLALSPLAVSYSLPGTWAGESFQVVFCLSSVAHRAATDTGRNRYSESPLISLLGVLLVPFAENPAQSDAANALAHAAKIGGKS